MRVKSRKTKKGFVTVDTTPPHGAKEVEEGSARGVATDAAATTARAMNSPALKVASLALLIIYPLLEVACYALLYIKRSDLAVRKRNMSIVRFASIVGWLAYINLVFSSTNRGSTCGVFYAFSILIPPVTSVIQLIRAIDLRAMLERNNIRLKEERLHSSTQQSRRAVAARRDSRSHSEKNDVEASAAGTTAVASSQSRLGSVYILNAGKEKVAKSTSDVIQLLRWIKMTLLYIPTAALLLATLSLSGGVLSAKDYQLCLSSETAFFLYVCPALPILVSLLTLTATTLIRKSEDELGIRREITRNAVILIGVYLVILILRMAGKNALHPVVELAGQIVLSLSMKIAPCFHRKGDALLESWMTRRASRFGGFGQQGRNLVPGYVQPLPNTGVGGRGSTAGGRGGARSSAFRRISTNAAESDGERRREVTMSLDAGLCILLSTQDGINSFSEHCVREFSYENIRFWCAVNDFHAEVDLTCVEDGIPSTSSSSSSDGDGDSDDVEEGSGTGGGKAQQEERQADEIDKLSESELLEYAQEIFEVYIATEGELQINIPQSMVNEIRTSLEDGKVRRGLFDKAGQEIFNLMSRDSFPRYIANKRKASSLLQKSVSRRRNRVSAVASG